MPVKTLRFDGENGADATLANTGYERILRTDTDGFMQFDDSWYPRGGQKMAVRAKGTTTPGFILGASDFGAVTKVAVDQPMMPIALPTTGSETQILWVGNGETRYVTACVTPTGILRLRDGASVNAYSSPAGVVQNGQKYIVSLFVEAHSTAGRMRMVLFAEDNTTVLADSGMLTGRPAGAGPITTIRSSIAKHLSTSTIDAEYLFGAPRWDADANDVLGPPQPHKPVSMEIDGGIQSVDIYIWHEQQYTNIFD